MEANNHKIVDYDAVLDKSQYTFTEGEINAMVAIIFGCLVLLFFVIKRHKKK